MTCADPITVGAGVSIGANAVVVMPVPAGAVVVPGRGVRYGEDFAR